MAFVVALHVLAAALAPDAQAAHQGRTPLPPPRPHPIWPPAPVWPPPQPCFRYLEEACRHFDCGVPDDTLDGFTVWDYCCRPDVPPVASPGLSSAHVSSTSSAECGATPGFPGLSASAAAGQGSSAAVSTITTLAAQCVTPLAGLSAACGPFLTKADPQTPAPQSKCCAKLVDFVNGSSTAADDDGDRDTLRCISPTVMKHVNKLLDVPLDPARMIYLPMQCGVMFPPETLYICLTGHKRPPLVSRIPEAWEKL